MANFKEQSLNIWTSFRYLVFISVLHTAYSISLDSNGYYDIVIAINEKTAQNDNENYLENLKTSIQDLSDAIHESTYGNFSIRSADILLPEHWNVDADGFVTTQSYQNADIRIYHDYTVPQAINPTFCGHPGHFIELPYSFFDEHDHGPYGPTGKALLTLWARYRWGIFEEHGFPGDPMFPYWWKHWQPWEPPIKDEDGEEIPSPDPGPQPWKVTSCSNVDIKGHYETLTGEECGPGHVYPEPTTEATLFEDEDDIYPPHSDCRFWPEIEGQQARTSLMSFPFIRSLTDFCNAENHNKLAPNRQNLFCQYKSAWEVILQSKDYLQLKEGRENTRTPINFRFLKKSEKPLLFILNEGVNMPPEEVISGMEARLLELFNKSDHWNVITSLASFPGEKVTDSFDTLYPGTMPWYNIDELTAAFRASFERLNSTHFRDFGAALLDIANEIRSRDHKPGAIILMTKFGTETDYDLMYQWPMHEGEVTAAILQSNIRLFVLEGEDSLSDADPSNPYRLKRIAGISGGLHLPIGNGDEDLQNVNKIMDEVEALLTSGQVPASNFRLGFKDSSLYYVEDNIEIEVPIWIAHKNVKSISFYFYSGTDSWYLEDVKFSKGPDPNLPVFNDFSEWGKEQMWLKYRAYLAEWTATGDPLQDPSEWACSYLCRTSTCEVTVIAIVELAESTTSTNTEEEHGVQMQIFTSAENDGNVIDLNTESPASLKGVAFAIYAKLEKNGHPVKSPDLQVTAYACHYLDGRLTDGGYDPGVMCHEGGFALQDNGPLTGDPDLIANDGIFSGIFTPEPVNDGYRGNYHIYVTAQLKKDSSSLATKSGPLPIDQGTVQCGSSYQGCWSETINEPLFLSQDLHKKIYFLGKSNFTETKAAVRILDLRVARPSSSRPADLDFDLEWTETGAPNVGGNMRWRADLFQIYYSHNFEELLQDNWVDKVDGVPLPSVVGKTSKVTVTGLREGEKRWYKMRSIMELKLTPTPVWSNVVFVEGHKEYLEITTTTTTTTTPAPTPPTTRLPPTSKRPSTLPTRTTTEVTTTTKRIITRPTTRNSTTVPSTTPKATPPPFIPPTTEPPKRWFKSPEAIAMFSVFSVLMVAIIGGVLIYMKVNNRG